MVDPGMVGALQPLGPEPIALERRACHAEHGGSVLVAQDLDPARIVRQVAAAVSVDASLSLLAAEVRSCCHAEAAEVRDRHGLLRAFAGGRSPEAQPFGTVHDLPLHRGPAVVGFVRLLASDAGRLRFENPDLAMLIDLTAVAIGPVSYDSTDDDRRTPGASGQATQPNEPAHVASGLLDFISEHVCNAAGADFTYVSCRFPNALDLHIGAHGMRSPDWTGLLTRAAGGLNDRALALMQPISVVAAGADSLALPVEVGLRFVEGAQTLICVPSVAGGADVIVTVGWRRTVSVGGHRLESIQEIVALMSDLLPGDSGRQALVHLTAAVEITSGALELDGQSFALLERAALSLGIAQGAILLLDNRSGGLTPLARLGLPPAFFRGMAAVKSGRHTDTSSRAVALCHTVITDDIMVDEGWAPYRGLAAPLGLRAAWAAPIIGHGACAVGALTVYRSERGAPTGEQRALLEVFAAIVARAYDQSRQTRKAESVADPAAIVGPQLMSIVEELPCGVIVLDEQRRVVFRNDNAVALCHDAGCGSAQDFFAEVPLSVPDVHRGPRRLENWQTPVARALRGESVPACELLVGVGAGEQRRQGMMVAAAPLRDGSGRTCGAVIMLGDSRREHALARDLAAAEAQLSAIQEATPYGVALLDARGAQVWATAAAARFAQPGLELPLDAPDEVLLDVADEDGRPISVTDLPIRQAVDTGQAVTRKVVQWRGPGGDARWLQLDAAIVSAENADDRRFVLSTLDITAYKEAELALTHQAMHDSLTGLPNRAWFHLRLAEATARVEETGPLALLVMDIDRFREVNDTLGHANGDTLVQLFARRLLLTVGSDGIVGRLGGDEFGVLMECATVVDATSMARKVLRQLEQPFEIAGQTLDVDASIGLALCPDHGVDAGALFRRADIAMYVAKHSHDGFAVYAARLDQHSPDRLSLLGELRRSIEQGHLFLTYQPLMRISDQKLIGMEALVRWQHPVHGLIYPDGFISLAEGTGAIKPLTIWVLNEALRQCSEWRKRGHDLEVSVNLSARNLHDVSLASTVLDSLLLYRVPPNRLTLEITESAIMSDPTSAMIVLSRLSNMGVRMAIDDFGTGYSSLAYLQRLPTRSIKIDKSFVLRLCEDGNDAAIVKAIIDLGHSLGHSVLAEGVENESVLALLAQLGCDFAQGYYYSKPLPASEIEAWVRNRQ